VNGAGSGDRPKGRDIGAFVPTGAEPAKVFQHGLGEFGFGALGVEIFVAKSQYAFVLERALVGRPEGSGVADVKQTGRRGGETAAVGGLGHGMIVKGDR
jgi:hypothetical protein